MCCSEIEAVVVFVAGMAAQCYFHQAAKCKTKFQNRFTQIIDKFVLR